MPVTQPLSTGWKTTLFAIFIAMLTGTAGLFAAETETGTAETSEAAPTVNDTPIGRVARAVFTSSIVDREPVDQLDTLSSNIERVFFFSDLREMGGQIVTHRWQYDGRTMAEVTFKVGNGARWRVYSSKNLLPEWTGTWTVVVSNESGQALQTSSFEYTAE